MLGGLEVNDDRIAAKPHSPARAVICSRRVVGRSAVDVEVMGKVLCGVGERVPRVSLPGSMAEMGELIHQNCRFTAAPNGYAKLTLSWQKTE
ncbi:hypothetical protein NIES30_24685 [Phormidium tenue NIES-30]|uniref:Uncharacterized protein n=1 Tax=Phormidium tenue NIES-30 TaxID=549789 RepID=A0A1U7IY70_9CYAN|nr:hypothetical protein NIES30_24685 [Phormidium tenue NIES-30]